MYKDFAIALDLGTNENGIHSMVTFQDGFVTSQKTWDAQPILESCAQERADTQGSRWGDMRKIGQIPMAELNKINSEFKTQAERNVKILEYLRANPAFVSFDRFLKK
jgi:hypothetical protein